MNHSPLFFRLHDPRSAAGVTASAPASPASSPVILEADWLDEEEIRAGIRESVRTGRPAAAIFQALRAARR